MLHKPIDEENIMKQYIQERLSEITDEDIEKYKKEFNQNNNVFSINLKGARRMLEAKICKQIYDEHNGVRNASKTE